MNKRNDKYIAIVERAEKMNLIQEKNKLSVLMDIESADKKFNLDLERWLASDDVDFIHELFGITNNINRESGFPATDFGFFTPRFAR